MSCLLRAPLAWYFLTYTAAIAIEVYSWYHYIELSEGSHLVTRWLLAFSLACWVQRDSAIRQKPFPSDWAFFLAPIYVPIYVLLSRGWRGIGLILFVVGVSFAISAAGFGTQHLIYYLLGQ
jgi:hypothetical protein